MDFSKALVVPWKFLWIFHPTINFKIQPRQKKQISANYFGRKQQATGHYFTAQFSSRILSVVRRAWGHLSPFLFFRLRGSKTALFSVSWIPCFGKLKVNTLPAHCPLMPGIYKHEGNAAVQPLALTILWGFGRGWDIFLKWQRVSALGRDLLLFCFPKTSTVNVCTSLMSKAGICVPFTKQ